MDDHSPTPSDIPLPTCTHPNASTANFCDVCGARLQLQCPGCHSINRTRANYCSNCGMSLHDVRPTRPIPPPAGPSQEMPPTWDSLAVAPGAVPSGQTASETVETPSFPESPQEARGNLPSDSWDADAARLEDMKRFFKEEERRAARRPPLAWLVTAGAAVAGVVAILTMIYTAPPASRAPASVDANARTPPSTPPPVTTAALAQREIGRAHV